MELNNKGFVYLTKERLHELETELNELKTSGRKQVAEKIAEARSHGDLSENAEYDSAKTAQEHLEMRIGKYEEMLSRVKIIAAHDMPNDKIYILHNVKLKDLKTKEEFCYKLVSPEEADLEQDKISVTSPIGKALLGRKKNEEVEITVPAGKLKYKIVDIYK
ncbi:MAG: transcription elongation factor GreA [Chlorobi bacterium]|nr:transcription elongation factor GreA [Chlorobiota bacterium]MCI0714872.1 transcription elongation factor GreA [Chlorobiota bacterium]